MDLRIQLKGRNKKRLSEKLILFNNKIYKYRNNELIYVKPNDNNTYFDYTYGKKTNRFYPITNKRINRIQSNRSGKSSARDRFFKFVDALKKNTRLTSIRNGVHFDEAEQKLLLNIPKNRKATRLTCENPHYLSDFYTSYEDFKKILINDLTDLYNDKKYNKIFIDTKSYMVYKTTQDSFESFTTIKDIRRGESGFERICINKDDIPRYVEDYLNMIETYCINSDFARHNNNGQSIYQFSNIGKVEFTIVKLKQQYGGCNLDVQPYMKFTASNIHWLDNRIDNKCFFWSLIAALNRKYNKFYVRRITFIDYYQKYYKDDVKYFNNYSLYDIDKFINVYPVDRDNINLFKELENLLNIRLQIINCDGTQDKFDSCTVFYNGDTTKNDLIQLIYYTDIKQSDIGHWMPVVNEKNLRNILNNGKKWICPTCKRCYITKIAYTKHIKTCKDNINKKYKLQPYHTYIRYRDYNKEMKCVVFGACDYECSFKRTDLYNTTECGEHAQLLPLMLKCYIKSDLKNLENFNSKIYTADDPDFEIKFLNDLYEYGQKYLHEVQLNIEAHRDASTILKHKLADKCFICGHVFGFDKNNNKCEIVDEDAFEKIPVKQRSKFDVKCYHHNHQTGEYIGALCSRCNLQVSYKYLKIPIFFHNYSGFDCIFLRQAINRWNSIRVKQHKEPVYYKPLAISLDSDLFATWGIFSFQDSCKLMPDTLENLVENLKQSDTNYNLFDCVKEYAMTICADNGFYDVNRIMEVLTHKQVFPYSLITDMFSFKNKDNTLVGIPRKDICNDYLNETNFTQAEYNDMVNTCNMLGIDSLLDIYKNYLELDVRLLIDVLDNFSKKMIKSYTYGPINGNDPLWFFTISSFCRSMSTKYTEAVRTGIINCNFKENTFDWSDEKIKAAYECINRYKHSNGIRLLNHGEDELYKFINDSIVGGISYSLNKYCKKTDEISIIGYDCSSMYSRCLCEWLPFDLRFTDKFKSIDQVTQHILQSNDYDYLQYLFEVDLSLKDCYDNCQQMPPVPNKEQTLTGNIKLNLTLRDKYHVIIHQNALKTYLQLGCKITCIYRTVELVCAPIFYSFIHNSLQLRSKSRSIFDSNLYKLVNNSLFGSMIMNSANYSTIKYLTDEKKIEALFNKIYNIANVEMNDIDGSLRVSVQQQKMCNTPRIIGSSVLHYSKKLLYDFWYNYIVKTFKSPKLNFIETDSIYFNHKGKLTNDLDNKFIGKTAGKFKIEHDDIIELITLRSKMYAYKTSSKKITKRAKGIKKDYVDKHVTFDDYKDILESTQDTIKTASFNLIDKSHNNITINRVNKKLFSRENGIIDDKVEMIDKYTSIPIR